MPNPSDYASRDSFMEACVPMVLAEGTAADEAQAVAICSSMWAEKAVTRAYVEVQKADVSSFDARFIMSAATLDRVRDTIDPKAYDAAIKQVGDKLIALFNHNSDAPIGFWQNLKRVGDTLTGYIKFASVPVAQMVKTLINEGVPMGASIGFRGKGTWVEEQNGMHFTAIELMETSIVSTPAHPRAMQIAKQYNIELPPAFDGQQLLNFRQKVAMKRAADAVKTAALLTRKE